MRKLLALCLLLVALIGAGAIMTFDVKPVHAECSGSNC
jgi:hypothetical protein